MENNIIAGVPIGGMTDKYDIKILVCYLIDSLKKDISRQELNYIFTQHQYVNYFSFCEALSELLQSGHLTANKTEFDEVYSLNKIGFETSEKLRYSLPSSFREKILKTAMEFLARIKRENENEVQISSYKNGYKVSIIIHDTDFDLMKLELFAPDMLQSEKIKDNFLENPTLFYQTVISSLIDK